MEILNSAIRDLKEFFSSNSISSFEPVVTRNNVTIEFELPVDSFVGPHQRVKNFSFKISLRVKREGSVDCEITTKRGSHIPFHPHFEVKRNWPTLSRYARWIGFERGERAIHQHVEHLFYSLQYRPGYISVENELCIGNKKALFWFLREHYLNADQFPTGHTAIQKKHFEVNPSLQLQERKRFEVSSPGNTQSKKKFAIKEEIIFNPGAKRLPAFDVDSRLNSLTNSLGSDAKIFITQTARENIFSHIRWGDQNAAESKMEQGGLLLGKVYRDDESGDYFGIAEQGIPGRSAQGSAIHLDMTHETWREMIESVDRLLSNEENKDLQIIGWYHTHPNELEVFMSGTDKNTQRNYFNQDWHFAIVLNPQRKYWKAFSGAQALECFGYFLTGGDPFPHDEAGEKQESYEWPRAIDNPKQSWGLNKLLVVLMVVTLIIVLAAKISRITSQASAEPAKQAKKNSQANAENKAQPRAVMPAQNEEEPPVAALKEGTIIYNGALEQVFDESLANPLPLISSKKRNDDMMNIEAQLFVFKDGVKVAPDLSLKIYGKLRNTDTASKYTLVGVPVDTLIIARGEYQKEKDWYKFTFSGVAKP